MLFYDTVLGDTEENCYPAYLSNLDIPLIHFLNYLSNSNATRGLELTQTIMGPNPRQIHRIFPLRIDTAFKHRYIMFHLKYSLKCPYVA